MRIALAGNPNSGKTTLYNVLTGKNEHAGNWAGVTVEKREAHIKKTYGQGKDLSLIDLPGAYSMSPFTSEESITSSFIKEESPNVIINIVDATNISRSLFFTTQLLELGIPVVVALNKSDINKKHETVIDTAKLSEALGCPVFSISANAKKGVSELIAKAITMAGSTQKAPFVDTAVNYEDKASVEESDRRRFAFTGKIVASVETRKVLTKEKNFGDKIDAIISHKWLGLPIFALVMWGVFAISQTWLGPLIADFLCGYIDMFGEWVAGLLVNAHPFLESLLVNGIIGGFSAIIGFLPLVMVMYFLLALLEDCGYMARVAVIMDRFFKMVGLSGKTIIPMIIGTGCAIPGVMACRTIRNERERRTSAMLTPFMPCGAKIPVIVLFATVFFDNSAWVSALMYFLGVAFIFLGALLVRAITGFKKKASYFIIELPSYKGPSVKTATLSMLDRAKEFIIKAGTIILLCNALVQIMQSFNWQFQLVAEGAENTSILASIATPFAFLFIPLGFGIWQLAAAAITGFIAKENVVGTLAVVFSITNFIDPDELTVVGGVTELQTIMQLTAVSALAYLCFNLFTPPCFAAIGAMNAEMKSGKWLWGGIGLQLTTGYIVAFLVYQFGTLFTTGSLGRGFIGGLIAVLAMIAFVVFLIMRTNKKLRLEAKTN